MSEIRKKLDENTAKHTPNLVAPRQIAIMVRMSSHGLG